MTVFASIHPSRQALFTADHKERARCVAHQEATFLEVGEFVRRNAAVNRLSRRSQSRSRRARPRCAGTRSGTSLRTSSASRRAGYAAGPRARRLLVIELCSGGRLQPLFHGVLAAGGDVVAIISVRLPLGSETEAPFLAGVHWQPQLLRRQLPRAHGCDRSAAALHAPQNRQRGRLVRYGNLRELASPTTLLEPRADVWWDVGATIQRLDDRQVRST